MYFFHLDWIRLQQSLFVSFQRIPGKLFVVVVALDSQSPFRLRYLVSVVRMHLNLGELGRYLCHVQCIWLCLKDLICVNKFQLQCKLKTR